MSALCLILWKQTLKNGYVCVCFFFPLVVMEALWTESVGLTSQRGDTQPTISRKERKSEWVSEWVGEWVSLLFFYLYWCNIYAFTGETYCLDKARHFLCLHIFSAKYQIHRFEVISKICICFILNCTLRLITENSTVSARLHQSVFIAFRSEWELIWLTSWFVKIKLKLCFSAVSNISTPTLRHSC